MKKLSILLCCAVLLLSACATNSSQRSSRARGNTPLVPSPTATGTTELVPAATAAPSDTPAPVPTATMGVGSEVTIATDTTCRRGPGESYYKVFSYFGKDTVLMEGRNEASDWALVQDSFDADVVCWVPVAALAPVDWLGTVQVAAYPALPPAPTSITAPRGVCGTATWPLVVKWSPVVGGVEYQVYRNGEPVSTQMDGRYYDSDMPKPHTTTVYTYVVQATNDYGVSPHVLTVSVSVCGK